MQVGYTPVDDDLYREIILDHYRNPRHRGRVDPADAEIEASNPLCGDEIDVTLRVRDGLVDAVGFTGKGCSISQASASMMCEEVSGRAAADAADLGRRFRAMLLEEAPPVDAGDLEVLQGVRAYPVRVKCAVLAWNALMEALEAGGGNGERPLAAVGEEVAGG